MILRERVRFVLQHKSLNRVPSESGARCDLKLGLHSLQLAPSALF
jgi:hypothetical protein